MKAVKIMKTMISGTRPKTTIITRKRRNNLYKIQDYGSIKRMLTIVCS